MSMLLLVLMSCVSLRSVFLINNENELDVGKVITLQENRYPFMVEKRGGFGVLDSLFKKESDMKELQKSSPKYIS